MSKFTDHAVQQDVMAFKDQFDSAIADKVADALAQKKLEIAQTFFNPIAAEPEVQNAE